jgi:hypothetical protein
VNANLSEFFRTHGYAILRDVFSGEHVEQLKSHAKALRDRAERDLPDGVRYVGGEKGSAGHSWGINEITRPGWFDPVLVNAIGVPGLIGPLNDILVRPRAWGQKMLWAPRTMDYDLKWHRDIDHKYDALNFRENALENAEMKIVFDLLFTAIKYPRRVLPR